MLDNETMISEEKVGGRLNDPKDGSFSEVNSLRDVLRDIDSGEISELAVVAEGEERTTWFVWILVICSTISGLLFGAWRRFSYCDPGSLGCRLRHWSHIRCFGDNRIGSGSSESYKWAEGLYQLPSLSLPRTNEYVFRSSLLLRQHWELS